MVYEIEDDASPFSPLHKIGIGGNNLTLTRGFQPGVGHHAYFISIADRGYQASIMLGEEDMQNLFHAYLAVRRDMEERP